MSRRLPGTAVLAAGLVVLFTSSKANAAEFSLVEVPSIADTPVSQMKASSIVFSDQPGDGLVDPAVGFIRYEDWAKARPVHQQFLSLYPGYSEPNVDIIVDGTRRR